MIFQPSPIEKFLLMFLKSVVIKNFRSISYLNLDLQSKFRILVGKNESGKSNIIKALSLLSNDVLPTKSDVREILPNEKAGESALIWFVFETEPKDKEEIYKIIRKRFDTKINVEEKFIKDQTNQMNLKEFCDSRSQVLYGVDLDTEYKYYSFWAYDNKESLTKEIVKPIKIDDSSFFTQPVSYNIETHELAKPVDIDRIITKEKVALLSSNFPSVIHWTYNEENLLPDKINVNDFSADPDICIPLKSLFKLSGVKDIKTEIASVRDGSFNRYRNFLNKIAEHATEHFRSTWKEYKDISFILEPNGEFIEAGVKEKNIYTLQQRSDGFKRFISFLLMISVNVKNDSIKNTLILADEPDLSLHPSGVRYLRDELKRISQKNIVVASTHSIFMIDGDSIDDYLIVKKENEKTIVEKPTEKNVATEEVLYRALDFSVYELLKDQNILFEGWRDKKLFHTAINKASDELKNFYSSLGISHTSGVKNVKNITPIFELVHKKCIIVSDNDKAAKDKQKEFNKERNVGKWLRYDEIDSNSLAVTGEDYVSESLIKRGTKFLTIKHKEIKSLPTLNPKKSVISEIEQWLKNEQVLSADINAYIDEFKTYVFENVKPSDVSSSYFEMLEKLRLVIENDV